jgi:hypothetical protein
MGAMLLAAAVAVAPWLDSSPVRPEPDRIGNIYIIGNVQTGHGPILDVLKLYPGTLLPDTATLLRTEIRLLMRFHKRFDLDAGKRPTLKVLPRQGNSPYRDIEVHFPEKAPTKKAR